MTDVGTTPRKTLTPRERLKLFEEHKGICGLCGLPIMPGDKWRDEHLRALGLGGSNDRGNRAPVHIRCAEVKDGDDIPRIAKAKRQKMAALGIKPDGPKIANRGFAKSEKMPRIAKNHLPPRQLYEDVR